MAMKVSDIESNDLERQDMVSKGELRVGGWSIIGDRVIAEALCQSDIDFIGIDSQHGFFAFDRASVAIQVANLCKTPCFVRLPAEQLDWIPRYLDAGADGIVVAMACSAKDARKAVALSLYQPTGERSYGGGKRNGVGEVPVGGSSFPAPEIFVMIETLRVLENLEDIAATPRISGLYVGPVDLGLAMGRPYPLMNDDIPWRSALRKVVEVCEAHGIRSGMFAVDGDDARQWLSFGFRDVVLSSDISLLRRALNDNLELARSLESASGSSNTRRSADPYSGR